MKECKGFRENVCWKYHQFEVNIMSCARNGCAQFNEKQNIAYYIFSRDMITKYKELHEKFLRTRKPFFSHPDNKKKVCMFRRWG